MVNQSKTTVYLNATLEQKIISRYRENRKGCFALCGLKATAVAVLLGTGK